MVQGNFSGFTQQTFEFFMKKFRVHEKAKILLITSCIYVPFQLMKFMELAIKKIFRWIV